MASNTDSDATHVDFSGSSRKDEHHSQADPGPRMPSCLSCREKKRLCDRMKPSCTSCLKKSKVCIYADHKQRATIADLEEMLRRLEKKYAACLKAVKISEETGKPEAEPIAIVPGHQSTDDNGAPKNQASISTRVDDCKHSDDQRFSPLYSDPAFGGYHFDESFLAIPSYFMDASSRLSVTSSQSNHPESSTRIKSHSTRIVAPLVQIAPVETSNILNGSFEKNDSQHIEDDGTDARPTKRQRLKSPLGDIFDQSNSKRNESGVTDDGASNSSRLPRHGSPAPSNNDIAHSPTLRFSRATWWDCLLSTYSIWPDASHPVIPRHDVTVEISKDVYIFFKAAPVWLYFLHVPLFFDHFYHPECRADIQPALVLSILAYAKLVQSNHDTNGGQSLEERERTWTQSVVLRDLAQASFEASYNAGWVDLQLAQAAWILTLYEISPHRDCTSYRMQSSASLLDNIIRAMGLTSLDAMDPRVSTFTADGLRRPNSVTDRNLQLGCNDTTTGLTTTLSASISSKFPSFSQTIRLREVQTSPPSDRSRHPLPAHLHNGGPRVPATCPCESLSLFSTPDLLRSTPSWKSTPGWTCNASSGEIHKEEARRLVWNSVIMLGCNANARRAAGLPQLDLHISKPENFAVLFPGEDVYSKLQNAGSAHSGKETIWAMWGRTYLVWFACIRHSSRWRPFIPLPGIFNLSDSNINALMEDFDENFATRVWMETVAMERALDSHTCDTEWSMMFQTRENIFAIRTELSRGFRHSMPVAQTGVDFSELDRDSATNWVRRVDYWGTAVLTGEVNLHEQHTLTYPPQGHIVSAISGEGNESGRKWVVERPHVAYLCLGAMCRALQLWKLDRSLSIAAEAALRFRRTVDWYQRFWPCAEVQKWMERAIGDLDLVSMSLVEQ